MWEQKHSLLEDRIGSSISEVEASEIAEYVISCVTDDSSTTGIDSYLLRLDDSLIEKPVYSKTLKRIQNNSQ